MSHLFMNKISSTLASSLFEQTAFHSKTESSYNTNNDDDDDVAKPTHIHKTSTSTHTRGDVSFLELRTKREAEGCSPND